MGWGVVSIVNDEFVHSSFYFSNPVGVDSSFLFVGMLGKNHSCFKRILSKTQAYLKVSCKQGLFSIYIQNHK